MRRVETDTLHMERPSSWFEHFAIQSDVLDQYNADARLAGDDTLAWCLLNGKIAETSYVDWATRNYFIPFVASEFFNSPPDADLWARVKSLGPWSSSLVPLHEWDGVLLIGCLEPTEIEFPQPYRMVLASPRDLKNWWTQLSAETSAPLASEILSEPASESPSEPVSGPQASIEMPAGLNFALPPIESESTPDPSVSESEPAPETEMPQGMSISAGSINLDFSFSETPTEPIAPSAEASSDATSEASSETTSEASADSTVSNESTEALTNDTTQTLKVGDAKVGDDASNTLYGTGDARPFESSVSKKDLGAITLAHVLKTFSGAMVLLTDNMGKLRPWMQSEELSARSKPPLRDVDLTTPSIFRIVHNTKLPYHGYVMPSPVNDQFFGTYYQGRLPKHVTLVPVVQNDAVMGMIMGVAETEIAYRQSLMQMERMADEFSRQLIRFSSSKAA